MLYLLADIPAADIANEAVKWWGPPGLFIVVLGFCVYYLYKDNRKIQEKRVTEAKEASDKSQALAKEMSSTINEMTISVSKLMATAEHLRDIIMLSKGG